MTEFHSRSKSSASTTVAQRAGSQRGDGAPEGASSENSFRRSRGSSGKDEAQQGKSGGKFLLTDRTGDIRVRFATHAAVEGEFAKSSDTWIHLCRDGGGHLYRVTDRNRLDGYMRPGVVGLAGPDTRVVGSWPSMSVLSLGLSTAKLGAVIADLGSESEIKSLDYSRFYQDPLVEQLLIAIAAQAETHAMSTLFMDHALALLVLRLQSSQHKPSEGALSQRQLNDVCDYILEHLADEISLSALSAITGLSAAEFSRRFRVSTGEPPYAFVTRQRIRRAMTLLSDGSTSVEEIALRVGYLNGSQLARAFRKIAGRSPTQWRQEGHR